MKILSISVLY